LKRVQGLDKNEIFQNFKEKEGKEYNESVLKNIAALKEKKEEIKQYSDKCHDTKVEIDRFKGLIQKKQDQKNQEEVRQGIIDQEEYEYIKELKDLKR